MAAVIDRGRSEYDAILLDVDNGPDGLVRAANNRLYAARGLSDAEYALKPGGILAIWSAAPDASFTRRLKDAGYHVDEVTVAARSNGKGARHVIDVRNIGLVGGVELESIPGQPGKRAFDIFLECWERGVLIRTTGDTIAMSPPLIIEKSHIDQLVGTLADVLKTAA